MRTLICCTFLLSLSLAFAIAQDVPVPSPTPLSTTDPIKGVWKLNVDKSKNTMAPDSEVITIVSQDSGYKLTFDIKQSNDYNPKYDIVTDMKGAAVKPINADGSSGTNNTWRLTRHGANAFDMELTTTFGGWTDKYEVSPDGKTLTLRRVPNNTRSVGGYIEKDGTVRRQSQYVLVFERAE
jgi:hypothetical protein